MIYKYLYIYIYIYIYIYSVYIYIYIYINFLLPLLTIISVKLPLDMNKNTSIEVPAKDMNGDVKTPHDSAKLENSKPDKWRRKLKVLLLIVCTVFLIYQTYDLVCQWSSATQVSAQYDYQDNIVPAITVCLPRALSVHQYLQAYKPNLNSTSTWHKLLGHIQNHTTLPQLDQNDLDGFNEKFTRICKDNVNLTEHCKTVKNSIPDSIKHDSWTWFDMVHYKMLEDLTSWNTPILPSVPFNLSIPYSKIKCGKHGNESQTVFRGWNKIEDNFTCNPVEIKVQGILQGDEGAGWFAHNDPVESVVFGKLGEWKKCFTYYGHQDLKWKNTRMITKKISIIMQFKNLWFPLKNFEHDGYEIALHNPDEFPRELIRLEPFTHIEMSYSLVLTDQSKAKSMVQCTDYDLNSDHANIRMRSDCIRQCIQDIRERCNNCSGQNVTCLHSSPYQWTRDQMPSPQVQFTHDKEECAKNGIDIVSEQECKAKCRPKCVDRVFKVQKNSRFDREKLSESVVDITHSELPDQLIEVKPKMSTIDFFSQLGGLLGLWLGLSCYTVNYYLVKYFTIASKSVSEIIV